MPNTSSLNLALPSAVDAETAAGPAPTGESAQWDEPRNRAELETAFEAFNRLSAQLTRAYGELEQKVASLNRELATARRERAAQIAEKERIAARMAGLMAELPAGVVLVSPEGQVEEANPAARLLLRGLEVGAHWESVIRDNRVRTSRTDTTDELLLERHRRITLTRRELAGGACVVVLTDVTQVHDLQERVARNQRLSEMGEMAARLAHQVRTPVAAAMLYASRLTTNPDASARRAGSRILARLKDLESLVTDMLLFARGNLGEQVPFTVDELIDRALRALEGEARARVQRRSTEATSVRMLANPDLLAGALTNLVVNALECGAHRVEVTGRESEEGFVEVAVVDDGPGVPADIAHRIFEPFFTTRSGGTGLGLAVVRSAVEAFGGSVSHEASRAGGACFKLRIPIAHTHTDAQRNGRQFEEVACNG